MAPIRMAWATQATKGCCRSRRAAACFRSRLLAPRGVPGRSLGLIWLAPLFVIVPLLPAMGAFRVTVLDVGQGLAVLVQTHTHSLLYDTGPRFSETADAGNRIIAPLLRANGVARQAQ